MNRTASFESEEPEKYDLEPPISSTSPAPLPGFKVGGFSQHCGPDIFDLFSSFTQKLERKSEHLWIFMSSGECMDSI